VFISKHIKTTLKSPEIDSVIYTLSLSQIKKFPKTPLYIYIYIYTCNYLYLLLVFTCNYLFNNYLLLHGILFFLLLVNTCNYKFITCYIYSLLYRGVYENSYYCYLVSP